jgi:limonene-1,2-epoxide hydrolase
VSAADDPSTPFARALAAIDAANAEDPTVVTVRGRTGPKEVLHADLVTQWVRQLRPDAGEALLLAARGHHLRRWTVPRRSYPSGRAGYLRWRRDLHEQHARELGAMLEAAGCTAETIARVQALVRKRGLGSDDEVQTLEDALCLVFLETQLDDVAARLDREKLATVLDKTARKMSAEGIAAIARLPLDEATRTVLADAVGPAATVRRYLDGLAEGDWEAVASTLADDVERIGPYRDVVRGRDAYTEFLRSTITALPGYELGVARLGTAGAVVVVELHETVDAGDGRLRTHEAVVFDVRDGLVARVAVYVQASQRL